MSTSVTEYLKRAVDDGASDLFIIGGSPVCEKLEKRLVRIDENQLFPDDTY